MSAQSSPMPSPPTAGGAHEPPVPPHTPSWPPPPAPQVLPGPATTALHVPPPAGHDPVLERLLARRIVFLAQELDDAVANRLCAQLLLLAAEDADSDITLCINAPGGSLTAGMAVHDTMRAAGPDVATRVIGVAAGVGQFLLGAGAPGKRYALPHARVLMHQPPVALAGSASDIAVRAAVHAAVRREIAELTAGHTGRSVETITADSARDRWFTAPEARDYGLVDHVLAP